MNYVIATIKPWNIRNFEKYFGEKENFALISQKEELHLERLKQINPRYIFFPHWSWIIPQEIWGAYECVTIHETDLPYGRGGSPIQNLIERGHKQTKISAIRIDEGLDTGPVYLKRDLSLEGSAQEIFERASEIVFSDMIPTILKEEPQPTPQEGEATVFKRRTPNQGDISLAKDSQQLYNLIRMLDAQDYPKAYAEVGEWRVEFKGSQLEGDEVRAQVIIKKKGTL
jgi:methionyl-tRNA formyltransferase